MELSINTIVIIALALLVLVTVGGFFVSGQARLGTVFSNLIGGQTSTADLQSAVIQCQQLCTSMQGRDFSSNSVIAQQPFCTTIFKLKEDGNPNNNNYCTDSLVAVDCTVLINGQQTNVDRTLCSQSGAVGVVTG